MQPPIKKIVMQKYETGNVRVTLEAHVDDDGSLNLEGYDIGDFVEKHWGDSDYEYFLFVKKENKEKILPLLLKDRFGSMSEFQKWLDEEAIPSAPAPDFEAFLAANPEYNDTILLLLLQEQFQTMSNFMTWLDERNIPKEFGSWA
ncbi:MAG: hypothetical protein ACE145_18695 [Terriglobia bacterium]